MQKPLTMSPPTKLVTADELFRMPDNGDGYELVEGRLIPVSRPGARHSVIAMRLGGELYQFVKAHRLGTVFAQDAGFKLASDPDTVRGPDVSFVRVERLSPGDVPRSYWSGAPDLAVEIRSPNDRRGKIDRKLHDYLRAGVRMIWFIEPDRRTVTVYRPDADPVTLPADEEVDGGDVVPGFRLRISDLFD
ncbi:MAG: Uma2 family endonuclease [Acidobacteria bacterium]|nr:Uma2 family endonuclease [Acidobacteriota bacterium]